jgi:hypothetical protein
VVLQSSSSSCSNSSRQPPPISSLLCHRHRHAPGDPVVEGTKV